VIIEEEDYLAHYGVLRRSGRYPWGSGGNSSSTTRHRDFLQYVDGLKKSGMSDVEIAKGVFGEHGTTTQLRAAKSIAKAQQKQADITRAQQLKNLGHSNSSIGREMGINESSVRALLAPGQKDKADVLEATKSALKEQVAKKKYIDVGVGNEYHLSAAQGMHISDTKLRTAVAALEQEGYVVHNVKVTQLGTGKLTTIKTLAAPGTTFGEVSKNRYKIQLPTDQKSDDGGRTYYGNLPPISVRSSRIAVRYADQGGKDADGVIYVRPGVKDLSLGANHYAQVRIMVDGTHFLKGMAIYKDDLPDGVDLEFNTNKHDTGHKHDAMKPLSGDPDNPFGATFDQITVPDKHGGRKVTSAMNLVNEEGDWERWSKTLSSQFLSKQSPKLAKSQLAMMADNKQREFDEIMALNNPAVKRRLLQSFADDADSAAVHLKAAHLPRQKTHVIMPISSMKDTEVYAPNFNNGERVVLIRHPHAGTFEIPELTVNNRNPQAKKLLGNAPNAIGINARVAQHLSGADFDGDTVIVIPNGHGHVKTSPALEQLKGFDPMIYKLPKDSPIPRITGPHKQNQMGVVSNLITDMTIHGASQAEVARAVRHSMVVIDAEKHELNYKQSEIDNGIKQLQKKYQSEPGKTGLGASTLISRAKSRKDVLDRRERSASEGGKFDKKTGKLVFVPTGATTVTKDGRTVPKMIRSTKLAETDNAHTLVSSTGTPIERIYADHSNQLKAMANRARVELGQTTRAKYSPSAKTAYASQVQSLNAKLNIALRNAPLERNAQVLANAILQQKKQANPNMDPAHVKRIKSQALDEARRRLGAKKDQIEITGPEWEAIQAGAISDHKLNQILENTDLKKIKTLATPRTALKMTPAKLQRAQSMLASGYTQAEVAAHLGVGLTTLKVALKEG
jgi:DNA-binding CsgD family transcriptional regulator